MENRKTKGQRKNASKGETLTKSGGREGKENKKRKRKNVPRKGSDKCATRIGRKGSEMEKQTIEGRDREQEGYE